MVKKGQPKKKKKKLRLRVNVLIKLLVIIAVVATLVNYALNLTIKNIYITGNNNVKDVTIIEQAGLQDYPKVSKINVKKIKEQIDLLPLINNTKVSINIFGKITIKVEESKILFYYKYNNKYITSTNESIPESSDYYGYPTLVNFTPDIIFDELVTGLNKIDYNIVRMINEIEYTPYKAQDGTIIDDGLFTVTMNDGNTVMIDTVNIKNLNKYPAIYASLGMDETKGIVYLDTIIEERLLFKSYATMETEEIIIEESENKEEKTEE